MIRSQLAGLLKASHFGPNLLVVAITCILSLTQFSIRDSIFIAFAILLGQFVVGWSNDLIDFPRDKGAGRIKKPLVAGTLTEEALKISLGIALPSTLMVSLMSPLGVSGTAIHFIGLLSATAYNFKLKSTLLSVVPYIVSFGALPWAIYVAAGNTPPTWIVLGFILFASAFHFLNVIKDLEVDIDQKVMGLPQVLGRKKSIAMAALLGVLGIVDVALANVRI